MDALRAAFARGSVIRQATVDDVRSSRITRRHGLILVTTRFYPRYLKKVLVDRYASELAPPKELLLEFKAKEASVGDHDAAFEAVDYESKFVLPGAGISTLKAVSEQSGEIYFVCHCKVGHRCHREILMLIAREMFGAKISRLHFGWETILKRIPDQIVREA